MFTEMSYYKSSKTFRLAECSFLALFERSSVVWCVCVCVCVCVCSCRRRYACACAQAHCGGVHDGGGGH